MPFVFLVFGALFLIVAIRGTQGTMFTLLKSEFVGAKSFIPWVAAILILGALGYVQKIKPMTDAFIGLILLVMLLANKGGFFAQLNQGIANPTSPAVTPTAGQVTNADSATNPGSVLPGDNGMLNNTQTADTGGGSVPAKTTGLWQSFLNAFTGAPSGPDTSGYNGPLVTGNGAGGIT